MSEWQDEKLGEKRKGRLPRRGVVICAAEGESKWSGKDNLSDKASSGGDPGETERDTEAASGKSSVM